MVKLKAERIWAMMVKQSESANLGDAYSNQKGRDEWQWRPGPARRRRRHAARCRKILDAEHCNCHCCEERPRWWCICIIEMALLLCLGL